MNSPQYLHQCGRRVKTKSKKVLGVILIILVKVTGENW